MAAKASLTPFPATPDTTPPANFSRAHMPMEVPAVAGMDCSEGISLKTSPFSVASIPILSSPALVANAIIGSRVTVKATTIKNAKILLVFFMILPPNNIIRFDYSLIFIESIS